MTKPITSVTRIPKPITSIMRCPLFPPRFSRPGRRPLSSRGGHRLSTSNPAFASASFADLRQIGRYRRPLRLRRWRLSLSGGQPHNLIRKPIAVFRELLRDYHAPSVPRAERTRKAIRRTSYFKLSHYRIVDDLVFPSQVGTVLNMSNMVVRYFLPALERAGLRRVRFHDLRHTFGSLLIQEGAPLTYVRDQMGHSSIKITVDTYGHLIPSADIAYMDRLDRRPTRLQQSATQTQPRDIDLVVDSSQVTEGIGVSDGIRTRDVQIHNLALYQAELRSPLRTWSLILCNTDCHKLSTWPEAASV